MSLPKVFAIISIFLFGLIGVAALIKGNKSKETIVVEPLQAAPLEVELDDEIREVEPAIVPVPKPVSQSEPFQIEPVKKIETPLANPVVPPPKSPSQPSINLPEANRIQELFNKDGAKLPIVQTITYKSRVSWQKGRPAWLSDYASHYNTSRHFIARSLNGKPDYFKMDVADGDRFNVFRLDKKFNFYLLIDGALHKMWFFYHDMDENQLVLIKTYKVGLGRIDDSKNSGSLTPTGKYLLGEKVAIYKPKVKGHFKGEKIEMIRVFGTRWIPFDRELEGASAPAKGYGIHGTPWTQNAKGELVEDNSSLGKDDSDGCIRLATKDMEELFSIIITKPTTVEIVKNFHEAKLPAPIK